MIELDEASIDWLECLPPTPKRVLGQLIAAGSTPEEAIELWLGAGRGGIVVQMGGVGTVNKQSYSAQFLAEVRLLICTNDPKYKSLRDQMPKINKGSLAGATALVSTALAPHLGVATALVAPAVVLAFMAISKMTIEVWCTQPIPSA
jgi:hypothetical protein